VDDLLGRLNLHEEDEEGFVWEDEAPDPHVKAKWLAVAKVHTTRGFSPSAMYADMRSTWNPARGNLEKTRRELVFRQNGIKR
jgi:hypothetical protein